MSENQVDPQDVDSEAKKTAIMIKLDVEIAEGFYNFLKDYLAFFGSGMTVEELVAQMAYSEARNLHLALTAFVKEGNANSADPHYIRRIGWLRKYELVAKTTGNWPEGLADTEIVDEETEASQ